LENEKKELGIDYYSISMAKMESIFREIIEDEKNNSYNDCSFLC